MFSARRGSLANIIIPQNTGSISQTAGTNVWSTWAKIVGVGKTSEPMVVTGLIAGGGSALSSSSFAGSITIQYQLALGATGSEVVVATTQMQGYVSYVAAGASSCLFALGKLCRVTPFILPAGAILSMRSSANSATLAFLGAYYAVASQLNSYNDIDDLGEWPKDFTSAVNAKAQSNIYPLNVEAGPVDASVALSGVAWMWSPWIKVSDSLPFDYLIPSVGIGDTGINVGLVGQIGVEGPNVVPNAGGPHPLTEFGIGGRTVINSPFAATLDLPRPVIVKAGESLWERCKANTINTTAQLITVPIMQLP